MKHCNTCNTSKPLSEFYKSKATKDGLQAKCKECVKQHDKQYNQDNKEDITEYQRQLNISEGYGVYTLTHLPTQYYYVGEGQLYIRRIKHFSLLKRGKNKYGLLQEHYDKHPNKDDWEFEVIRKWDLDTEENKKKATEMEVKLIKWGFENVPNEILNKTL